MSVLWAVMSILLVVPLVSATVGAATVHRYDAPPADLVSAESSPSVEGRIYHRTLGWDGDDNPVSVVVNETAAQLTGRASHAYDAPAVVPYGTKGSVRLDAVIGSPGAPSAIYDLKTGSVALTASRIAQIRSHLPPGFQDIPVLELRPG